MFALFEMPFAFLPFGRIIFGLHEVKLRRIIAKKVAHVVVYWYNELENLVNMHWFGHEWEFPYIKLT